MDTERKMGYCAWLVSLIRYSCTFLDGCLSKTAKKPHMKPSHLPFHSSSCYLDSCLGKGMTIKISRFHKNAAVTIFWSKGGNKVTTSEKWFSHFSSDPGLSLGHILPDLCFLLSLFLFSNLCRYCCRVKQKQLTYPCLHLFSHWALHLYFRCPQDIPT